MWTVTCGRGSAMGEFAVPTKEQQDLCLECGIDPKGILVILENDGVLAMLHMKTRNEVLIVKGEAQRRKEQNEPI